MESRVSTVSKKYLMVKGDQTTVDTTASKSQKKGDVYMYSTLF